MDNDAIRNELSRIIEEFLKKQNLDFIDLVYRYEGRDLVLRVLVDRPEGGISIDDCAYLNRKIDEMLEEKGILEQRYILEVSSPGLDRPLKTKQDFLRCINKRMRFHLSEQIAGKLEHVGAITKVEGETVYVDIKGNSVEIPIGKIAKAKQEIEGN